MQALQSSVERRDDLLLDAIDEAAEREEAIHLRALEIAAQIVSNDHWLDWLDARGLPICDIQVYDPDECRHVGLDKALASVVATAQRQSYAGAWVAAAMRRISEQIVEWLAGQDEIRRQAEGELFPYRNYRWFAWPDADDQWAV